MKPSTRIPRKKKKMALYEVFSKGLANSRRRQGLETLPSAGHIYGQGQKMQARPWAGSTGSPRAIQFNHGRVEISLRYDVAIVVLLAVVLCLMGAYRLGEHMSIKQGVPAEVEGTTQIEPPATDTAAVAVTVEPQATASDEAEPAGGGDNWIVIATHQSEGQLAPVQQYFAGYGIETQIRKYGDNFILHTKQTYGNPNRSGSDGEQVLRRIVALGMNYVAPPGYRSFDFTTAYGMKKVN